MTMARLGSIECAGRALFVLSLPTAGSVLGLQEVLPVTAEGQGIAWDRSEPGTLYSILRSTREVVVSKLR